MMSRSVEVTCGECGESLGDQYKPGDAVSLYVAHRAAKHPDPAADQ